METKKAWLDALQKVGVTDPAAALQKLLHLAGRGVTDEDIARLVPPFLQALLESPDPNRSLLAFCRWFEATNNPLVYLNLLCNHPVALEIFAVVTGCSQLFADLLVRQPECFELIADPGQRGESRSASVLTQEIRALVEACRSTQLKKEALRRWKAREMLRIGVRDLAGIAGLEETARAFSDLADACLQAALDIAYATLPQPISKPAFAVISMGKLGGRELNYSSDIDLLFLHEDNLPQTLLLEDGRTVETLNWLNRLAETFVNTLSEDGPHGHVFRVDMRLRPEGRFGPLLRSLSAYRFYYENWAEPWELQALIKARFVAGNRALGETFIRMITPFVYNPFVPPELLAAIVENKRRIERKAAIEGLTETNIKIGKGGIRDIEFLVQRLQLQHGGKRPSLRTPNTLQALRRLHHAGLLSPKAQTELEEDYIFLRTLEHRLQLLHGHQTQILPPPGTAERTRLARRMGFQKPEAFEAELASRRQRVHNYLQNLFYEQASATPANSGAESLLETLLDTIDSNISKQKLEVLLKDMGFYDPQKLIPLLRMPMRGNEYGGMPPDTPIEFQRIAHRLLTLAAQTPHPDAALQGFEALAIAVPNRAQLYAACDDSPQMLEKLVRLAGSSPPLFQRLVHHQEWLEPLLNPEEEESTTLPTPDLTKDWTELIQKIARYLEKNLLAIGAQEIWQEIDVAEVPQRLTQLAESGLKALLFAASYQASGRNREQAEKLLHRIAVFGLGKLGGMELCYQSDWDVIFFCDELSLAHTETRSQLQKTVELLEEAMHALSAHNLPTTLDLRLRPWGKDGSLITTPRAIARYHLVSGETWEKQALLKARYVAGNSALAAKVLKILHAFCYPRRFSHEQAETVKAMKKRIENERLDPAFLHTDIKLGHGGMLDIEWLVQWLQLHHGRRFPSIRCQNTPQALSRLADAGIIENAEADVLIAIYFQLMRARNALWLYTGRSQESLPEDTIMARAISRLLGYSHDTTGAQIRADIQNAMREARKIFERRFYAI